MAFLYQRLIRTLGFIVLFSSFGTLACAGFQVDVAEAPSDNLNLTLNAIQSARRSIYLNIYELSSQEIANAIVAQVQNGIHVEILEEGQPVGGLSTESKAIQAQIAGAMGAYPQDHLYVMTSKATMSKRRFRFDHGKYAIIDDTNLLLGSENYSPTGNPSPGALGNRGWEVFIHEAKISQKFRAIFQSDTQMSYGDLFDMNDRAQAFAMLDPVYFWSKSSRYRPLETEITEILPETLPASDVAAITSPDTSLNGLVNLIAQARSTIDIEQMTFDSNWKNTENPLLTALTSAAARGVQIRVLLNDESVFGSGKPKNQPTADILNQTRNITAAIADVKAMKVDYIHNKGMLIDGKVTLISSINWDENSVQNNREAAVAIQSPEIFRHYEAIFESDWRASQFRH